MKVLLCGDMDAGEWRQWHVALGAALPEVEWLTPAQARASGNVDAVVAAVVANPPPGSLQGLPRLRLIQSLWAGVDRLLADPTLPAGVPLARMVDPAMTAAMAETALWAVLSLHRGFYAYAERQRRAVWLVHAQVRADEVRVLVLGQGEMGRAAAARIAALGYRVSGWSRSSDTHAPLATLLPKADIVLNLLPLTPATHGLLNAALFDALPPAAAIVNLGRGAHVVDDDLLAALDAGHLRHAVLDVFHTEPLPPQHPYWSHPRVTVLPHAAAQTDPRSAAAVVAQNLRALQAGAPITHRVDAVRGY